MGLWLQKRHQVLSIVSQERWSVFVQEPIKVYCVVVIMVKSKWVWKQYVCQQTVGIFVKVWLKDAAGPELI